MNSGAPPAEVKKFAVATGPCSMFGVGLREKCAVEKNTLLKNAPLTNSFFITLSFHPKTPYVLKCCFLFITYIFENSCVNHALFN